MTTFTTSEQSTPFSRVHEMLAGKAGTSGWHQAFCPAHTDEHKPSLSYKEQDDGNVFLHCFAGCQRDEILRVLKLSENDLHKAGYKPAHKAQPFSLNDLAIAKKIPPAALHNFGVTDEYRYTNVKTRRTTLAVRIAYSQKDGSSGRVRVRFGASGHDQSWDENIPGDIIPYGLSRLEDAVKAGWLLIGEGESDAWTCWFHGLPYLGIPGASNDACLDRVDIKQELARIKKVYILQEPDQALLAASLSQSGKGFYARVRARLRKAGYAGEIFCLNFEQATGHKDPNAMHQALFAEKEHALFPERMKEAFRKALPAGDDLTEEDIERLTRLKQASPRRDLPKIVIGEQLRDSLKEVMDALVLSQTKAPTIFVYLNHLVKVARDKKDNPIIFKLGVPEMRNLLTQTANFYKTRKVRGSDEVELLPISPPEEFAVQTLAMEPWLWPFPSLKAIIEMPVLRADGTVLDTPGYDSATGLYYVANESMSVCKVPCEPSGAEIASARSEIERCIGEFCYESEADKAGACALLVTLCTRHIYKGDVQIALLNASKPGTGKGLLVNVLCLIATGRYASMTNFPQKEEEVKKVVDSKLLAGVPVLSFDNIKRKFTSATIDALATGAHSYSLRPLGRTEDINVDASNMTIIANGNNVQMDADMARRCMQIRLVSPVSSPDERDDFTIADLIGYTLEHRSELVAALLTLCRAWYVAGKPAATNKLARSASTYRDWANIVGGILEHAGIAGFQDNRDALKAESNEEDNQAHAFLTAWVKICGPGRVTVKTVADFCKSENALPAECLADSLPDDLAEALHNLKRNFAIVLGKWLQKRVKTPYGSDNIYIEKSTDEHAKQKFWRVVAGSGGSQSGPRPGENENESEAHTHTAHGAHTANRTTPHYPQDGSSQPANSTSSGSTSGSTQESAPKTHYPQENHYPQAHEPADEPIGTSEQEAILLAYDKHLGAAGKARVFLQFPLVAKSGPWLCSEARNAVRSGYLGSDSARRDAALDEMYFREHGKNRDALR